MTKRTKQWSANTTAASVEAAQWLARVRSGQFDEADFREWIEADELHQAAFAKVIEAWEIVGGLQSLYPEFAPSEAELVTGEATDAGGRPSEDFEEPSDDEATMVSGSGDRGAD